MQSMQPVNDEAVCGNRIKDLTIEALLKVVFNIKEKCKKNNGGGAIDQSIKSVILSIDNRFSFWTHLHIPTTAIVLSTIIVHNCETDIIIRNTCVFFVNCTYCIQYCISE